MLLHGPLSAKLTGKVFSGLQLCPMQIRLCGHAKVVNFLPDKLICQPKSCKPSCCPGRLRFGGLTWSAHLKGQSAVTHLFVAIDKFSKWIEAKPVITITADKARDFFINIVHRFGVPNRIITDNGTQFTGGTFKDFCEDFGIKICYASVAHPMSNGQVERANGMILQGIKATSFRPTTPLCWQVGRSAAVRTLVFTHYS